MFAVFLNNKLISCDSILPLMMELHAATGRPVYFFTPDARTYRSIQENIVLYDGIRSIGSLKLLGNRKRDFVNRFIGRMSAGMVLLSLAFRYLFGRADIFHFRALNEKPLSILALLGERRIYFCESDSYGETQLVHDVTYVKRGTMIPKTTWRPTAGGLIAFQAKWSWLHDAKTKALPSFVFGPTRPRKIWVDYVNRIADSFLKDEIGSEYEQSELLVFMLGFLGDLDYLASENSTKRLLDETIRVLIEEGEGRPIYLKPHVITDLAFLESIVSKYPEGNIIIGNLHPSVLATRAKFFVASYYTTTLGDAHYMNVPTIEFTEYSKDALAISEGGSMRPDFVNYFINGDVDEFRSTVRKLIRSPKEAPPIGISDDSSQLIAHFSK